MRLFVLIGFLLSLALFTNGADADTLREESFEGCTGNGYSLATGSFWGDTNDGILCGNDDNGVRDFTFSFAAGDLTGQHGSDYIALEDIVGAAASNPAAGLANPNAVVLTSTSITGYSNLGISFLFAAPNGVAGRYEASPADYLQLQYSVDGGAFVTFASFRGGGPGVFGMVEDDDLDGSFTQAVNGLAMQRFNYTLDGRAGQGVVSGATLVVKVVFSSDGAQEEMAFDDIIITGTPSVPVVDLSASSYQIGEDGTPVGGQVTLTRSGSTAGAASIDLTFSAGTATGGGVDFTSTTMSVTFGSNVTSVPVDLPIIDDALDENSENFTIALSADGSGAVAGTTTSASVTIIDDDTAAITVSESSVTVSEGGATETYDIVLESQPTADVLVEVESSSDEVLVATGGGQAASSTTLTFTSVNWSTPQTVTVSAIDDVDVEADPHSDAITHTVTSGELLYDGYSVDSVTVSIDDDDVCGDTVCNPTESTVTCPGDCGTACGDSACNGAETTANCSDDCGSQCGDGAVNGTEVCDGSNLTGEDCPSRGFDYGTLDCANDCSSFNTLGCAANTCGDGTVFGVEECDDGVNNSDDDPDACRTDCTAASCGDNVLDTGEVCDGLNLVGEDCVSLGFESGTLGCAGDCSAYNTSACQLAEPMQDAGADGGADAASSAESATSVVLEAGVSGAESTSVVSDAGPATSPADTSSERDETTAEVVATEATSTAEVSTLEATEASNTADSTAPDSTAVTTGSVDATTFESSLTSEVVNTSAGGVSWGIGESNQDAGADAGATTGAANTGAATTDEGGGISSEPDSADPHHTTGANTTEDDGPGPPSVSLDAGFDAGDGGFDVGGGGDGCDCRVGAKPRVANTHLFGLALLGLALVRIRRRRRS